MHYRPLEVSGRLFFPSLFQTFKRKDTGGARRWGGGGSGEGCVVATEAEMRLQRPASGSSGCHR